MEWYYVKDGERVGPVGDDTFSLLVREGEVVPTSLVWREGLADWTPYAQLAAPSAETEAADAVAVAQATPTTHRLCMECGHEYPEGGGLVFDGRQVCAQCKPLFFARLAEGTLRKSQVEYAGFWIRLGAWLVDFCLVNVFTMVCVGLAVMVVPNGGALLLTLFQVLGGLLRFATTIVYKTWFVGRFGATPGKMIFGLRVVGTDGQPLTFSRALGRSLGYILSAIPFCLGFIWAGFTSGKRSWHDVLVDTMVIREQ